MSHLIVKKNEDGYQAYDKLKEKFVGKSFEDRGAAAKYTKARDEREDKTYTPSQDRKLGIKHK